MLNVELARIVVQERRRRAAEELRQSGFRQALADRAATLKATSHGAIPTTQPCPEPAPRTKPALG